jgi:hypothetical protein
VDLQLGVDLASLVYGGVSATERACGAVGLSLPQATGKRPEKRSSGAEPTASGKIRITG